MTLTHARPAGGELPTSLAAFKKHDKYCLPAHLGRNGVIAPGAVAISEFKGQPVHLRSNIRNVYPRVCVLLSVVACCADVL